MSHNYWVYILLCNNNSYYTGYTVNLQRRYQTHVNGSGKCKYTRSFKPIKIAQSWQIQDKILAMKIEKFIKKLPRAKKLQLIAYPKQLLQCLPLTLHKHFINSYIST